MINLSEALKLNNTISDLDLSFNKIGLNPENIKYLSEALKVNKAITKLSLKKNKINQLLLA